MALDESKDDDTVVEQEKIKFLLDAQTSDILNQSGGLTIDYIDESYRRGYMLKLGATSSDCSSGGCSGCG
jgi:Fe-S cluster assembly iron-binding protein IscA